MGKNNQLKLELETVSDKLGNELQVKYLEIEGLKQKLEKINKFCKMMEEAALIEGGNNPYLNYYEELKEIIEEKK